MDNHETRLINPPDGSIKDRIRDMEMRTLRRTPTNVGEVYAASIAKRNDREILEQEVKELPRSLTELISVALRDEGNALIEETRQFNNRYLGCTIKTLEAQLIGDLEAMDLNERVLDWADRIATAVLFKMRRQLVSEPVKTYSKLYTSFIHEVDVTIAHGENNLNSLLWGPAMDWIPYRLLEETFFRTGLVTPVHKKSGPNGEREVSMSGSLRANQAALQMISQQLVLYTVAPTAYSRDVVLHPLLAALKSDPEMPDKEVQKKMCAIFVADLLEAFPYLVSSTRIGRSKFDIKGAETIAAFDFSCRHGFGFFYFNDNPERFDREIAIGQSLGALELLFDGKIAFYQYPKMTLESVFGEDDGVLMSYWLLKQAHERVVTSYLKINRAYLERHQAAGEGGSDSEETADVQENLYGEYVAWVREAQEATSAIEGSAPETQDLTGFRIPQMRRSVFFKLLSFCGVSIAQGKGSEIKLLRDNEHPFRLGNHYGPNPTVPTFLIASILKRLNISRTEWRQAIVSAGYA